MNNKKISLIKRMRNYIENTQTKKEISKFINNELYDNQFETEYIKFIWGIKSYDDLTGNKVNLYTMNDLDIIYLKDECTFILGVETIYKFDSPTGQYDYMKSLLDEFTKFMNENNYKTDYKLSLYEVFTDGININTHFHSIEEAYAAFKIFVNGYCS